MPELPFDIRHGDLDDVLGTAVVHEGVTFVPARVRLNGTMLSPAFPFLNWCEQYHLSIPRIVHGEENAPWVIGRLLALFGPSIHDKDSRGEKACFYSAFLAVLDDDARTAIPFESADIYGSTALVFSSEDSPSDELQKRIASAFYGLLLDAPDDLQDYEDRMFHLGSGVWVAFGVCHGEPYMDSE